MDKLKFLSGIDGIERKNLFSLIFDRIKKSEFSDSVSFTPFLTPADAILLEKSFRRRILKIIRHSADTTARKGKFSRSASAEKMIFRLLSLKFQRATKAFLNTEIISARCFRSELNAKK